MKLWVAAIALPLATALRLPLPFTRGLRLSVTRSRPRAGAARMPSSGDQLNKDLENVLSQNKAWSDKKAEATPHYFEDQAKSQHPKYLWIGCADARVRTMHPTTGALRALPVLTHPAPRRSRPTRSWASPTTQCSCTATWPTRC